MSSVVFQNGLRIWVNLRESQHKGRPHCHVEKGSAQAEIDLVTFEVMKNNGQFSRGDMNLIFELVREYHDELMDKWSEYHDQK